MTGASLPQRLAAEAIGTCFLLAAVVGSGIMAERLAGDSVGLALLCNAISTGAVLAVLILVFAPISGGHFNPAVSVAFALRGDTPWRSVPSMILAQVAGAIAGTLIAHVMFELPVLQAATTARAGAGQWAGEVVATLGLVLTILGTALRTPRATPYAVGLYITGAYWFTSSTSFANPAVTLARGLTDTFSGIRLVDTPAFILAQFVGMAAAVGLAAILWRRQESIATSGV